MKAVNVILVLVNALMLVSGQLMWKAGLMRAGQAFESLKSALGLITSPFIWGGVVLYGLATVMWLYILSRMELSVAYPMQSVAYVIAAVASFYIFGESMSLMKIAGCVVILIGVAMIGLSAK